jgi:hypothetical protein
LDASFLPREPRLPHETISASYQYYLSSIEHINTYNQIKLLEVRVGKAKEIVEQEINFCKRAGVGSQFTGYQ